MSAPTTVFRNLSPSSTSVSSVAEHTFLRAAPMDSCSATISPMSDATDLPAKNVALPEPVVA